MEPKPMSARVSGFLKGSSIAQRALRSSAFTMAGFAGGQALRLASNLILTRLLFPEAFGTMAMVSVFLMALAMFSDVGVGPAIMQSKRGDDRAFLDTAWTIQIIRGLCLFVVAIGLSWPVAHYFGEPDLIEYLPVAALTLVIAGFNPTKLQTANRHLRAGRVTMIELAVQAIGIAFAVALAVALQSVWALVISGVLSSLAHLVLLNIFLPGPGNRLNWEREAAGELIHFGKWIFLSTICGFAIGQADKVIIGGYLSTYDFGIYSIGFFLASFPLMLGHVVTHRVLIPIYRETPPRQSRENFLALRRMRIPATAALLGLAVALGFVGAWLVQLLYDPRYEVAGGIVVLLAIVQIPALIVLTYDQAALASGESRRYFVLAAARAALIIAGMVVGLSVGGLSGALVGLGLGHAAAYPVVVWLARTEGAWDPWHDFFFGAAAAILGSLAIWLNWPHISALAAMGGG
jgi:O-antigen/teichoic acid export membrane protein